MGKNSKEGPQIPHGVGGSGSALRDQETLLRKRVCLISTHGKSFRSTFESPERCTAPGVELTSAGISRAARMETESLTFVRRLIGVRYRQEDLFEGI